MTTTHKVDLDSLTILATGSGGETHDLNAEGEPCTTRDELRNFVRELHEQGAYAANTRDDLLADLA